MALAAVFLKLILVNCLLLSCAAFDNVGCLFKGQLCRPGLEWCHDDAAFGRCLPLSTDPSSALYQHVLNEPELVALEAALDELHQSGYQWSDVVTQCVLQRLLHIFQYRKPLIPSICYQLADESPDDGEDFVKADQALAALWMQPEITDSRDNQLLVDKRRPKFIPYGGPRKTMALSEDEDVGLPDESSEEDLVDRLKEILDSEEEKDPFPMFDSLSIDNDEDEFRLPVRPNLFPTSKFERRERLDVKKPGPWFSVNNFAFQKADDPVGRSTWDQGKWVPLLEEDYIYDTDEAARVVNEELQQASQEAAESENLHRIAVQKLVDRLTAEEDTPSPKQEKPIEEAKVEKVAEIAPLPTAVVDKFATPQAAADDEEISPRQYQVVDASYAYIGIKGSFKTWKQGAGLVKSLAELLRVPHQIFTDVRVEENQVVFRVLPNKKGLNASMVAARADEMRDKISQVTGLEVDVTGIGDQSKVTSALYRGQENQELLITIALCVLIATILAAAVALFVIRRRHQAQQKLKGLAQSADSEATRDYQDLCRARMATKSPAPIFEAAKESPKMPLTATSRDSESSRSSTSSWCEEPVVTNMDISTGHMVLTYMEDHLRNKDRLDDEWQALCAYEAEPSTSTLAASKTENLAKNRCKDVLPYDHSRVILNTLGNDEGSDYINASSIADHDPRHPAYIAAQSPLPETVVDFWQMIWEQGSVVLVLLTKTSENGTELCHPYWPQEGSQRYNYFEVHLVSEHIWCDDYLVRSFYLKNLRTGETRTVTQFHFLSWPENGVPLSTKALLEFRRKVNKSYRGRSCPIVVHCSDGAGRTGTYCLIDMVLHRMAKGAREIDIAATLEHLRDQRPKAVRTKQQFEFVLTAVAEEVHAILRALPQ